MILERNERFRRAYRRLSRRDQERVDRAIARFVADPGHPSLRVKRVQGTAGIWEARASDALRFTFQRTEGGVVLRNVGAHDATLTEP